MPAAERTRGIEDFAGRVAFITGGARGVGLGIARALIRRGTRVVIADRDPAALELAREALGNGQVHAVTLDVTDRERYTQVAAEVASEFGHVSLLFNNAGVIDSVSPRRMSYPMWDHVIGVNLEGVYNGIQAFVPAMIASAARSHIVNTASEAGLIEAGSGFLYHASKYAVVGLSESLRVELAHFDIGVSVLSPGAVATDIVENARRQRPHDAPAHSERVTRILDHASHALRERGASPEAVGELTIRAIEQDAPYVQTSNWSKARLQARTDAITASMDAAQDFLERWQEPVSVRDGD